jgi:GTP-binding protein Era
MSEDAKNETRCGFVAVIGAPNAGKSTLVNALVGAKIAIVTHKVQTTRTRMRGIALEGASQIVLVDTPGIFEPKRRLDRAMVNAAWSGAEDADLVALVVDAEAWRDKGKGGAAARSGEDTQKILDGLKKSGRKAVLVLNKMDRVRHEDLLALTASLNEALAFEETFLISAEKGKGVKDLMSWFASHVPEGPWLYPEDQIADAPLRTLAAEITREKLILRLHQELPYAITVETENWEEKDDGSARVDQVIFVERDGQKAIVLGHQGSTIKDIGAKARKEMAESFGFKVHLFLFVKVREKWAEDPERYRELGLDYPKG